MVANQIRRPRPPVPFDNSELTVDIPREVLVDKLKKNREKHQREYNTAMQGYVETLIEELEAKLADVKAAKDITKLYYQPAVPEKHLDEYDEAIEMYEMTVEQVIRLPRSDFRQLVRDNWDWKRGWTASNTAYISKASAR